MARYKCRVCGEIYDEARENIPFSELPDDWVCPLCHSPKTAFELMDDKGNVIPNMDSEVDAPDEVDNDIADTPEEKDLRVDHALAKRDDGIMDIIHGMAVTGGSISEPMETLKPMPSFDEILILGAQLDTFPKLEDDEVNIKTIIGKTSKKPMELDMPVFVSHMSFGALSSKAKKALAMGSARAKTAIGSGEGGALPEEMSNAYRYILEYVPNRYSSDTMTLREADAIEIKIGQSTKPGMGGHLPGNKVTHPVAVLRGKLVGQDIISPSRFDEIYSPKDLKKMVEMLRTASGGRPIGVKIAAGHIEKDLEFISKSGCDFITIDGRGGATGSSPKFIKDSTSIPTIFALARARKYMNDHNMNQELIITGGLRTSSDFAKAIAMGADAIAVASASLMALGCQRYRICDTGKCPMGIATQDPELEKRLDIEVGAQRVANYLNGTAEELRMFTRITGHEDIHDLSLNDICTTNSEISDYTSIKHV